jgi:hypothetical protein
MVKLECLGLRQCQSWMMMKLSYTRIFSLPVVGVMHPGYHGPPVTIENSVHDRIPLAANGWGIMHPIPGKGRTTPG